jgi:hypothetical protein
MQQVNRIENVWKYKFEKERDILWIVTMDRNLKALSPKNDVLFGVDQYEIYDLDVLPDSTIVFSTLNPAQTFFLRDETLTLADFVLHLSGMHNGDKFYCVTGYKGEKGYSRLDMRTRTLEEFWPPPFAKNGIELVAGDKFVSVKKRFITISRFSDGAELTRHDYAELLGVPAASYYGNVVAHNGLVYFYVVDDNISKNAATFCMEEATGKTVQKWDNFGGNLCVSGDNIYAAFDHAIGVLDTVTGQTGRIDLEAELKPLGLQIRSLNSLYTPEGLLYFVDGHWAPTNRMGIIDLKAQKLTWHTELAVNDNINNSIVEITIRENKLYAYTSDRDLHIFKIE